LQATLEDAELLKK
jgi:uncharacterized protein (DUF2126 family)